MCIQSTYTQSRTLNSHHRYISRRTPHIYIHICVHVCVVFIYIYSEYTCTFLPSSWINMHTEQLLLPKILQTKPYSPWRCPRHSYNYIYNTHNMGLNTNVQLIYHWDVHTEYTHTEAQQVHNCLMYNSKKTHMQSHSPKIHILQISEHTRNLHSLLNPHIHQNTHLITPGTPITHRHKPPTLIKYSWTSNNLGYRVPTLHSVLLYAWIMY